MVGKRQTKKSELLKEWINNSSSTRKGENFVDSYHIDELCPKIDRQDWINESLKILRECKTQIQEHNLNIRLSICITFIFEIGQNGANKIVLEEPPEIYVYNKDNKNISDTISQWTQIAQISGDTIYVGKDWYDENILRLLFWITLGDRLIDG